jgi:hypothetical protein
MYFRRQFGRLSNLCQDYLRQFRILVLGYLFNVSGTAGRAPTPGNGRRGSRPRFLR